MSTDAAKEVISSIANFFSSNPVDLQWNDEAALAAHEQLKLDPLEVVRIIREAGRILHDEQTLLKLEAPVVVVGDIHGQCFDLLNVFNYTGATDMLGINKSHPSPTPSIEPTSIIIENSSLPELEKGVYRFNPKRVSGLGNLKLPVKGVKHSYLFLGDYVDRGQFSTECALLLLAMKVVYPSQINLLRGNHESRCMTQWDYSEGKNFHDECVEKYGEGVYDEFMKCFDNLPLAALLESELGKWLCCHGGIGAKLTDLDVISSINRFVEPPFSGAMCDLMWADPLLSEILGKQLSNKDYKEFLELDYLPNPPRGCSCFYGYAALAPLLKQCDLLGVIRAHQCKEEGIHFSYTDNREQLFPFPLVTTVFSASNYCGTYTNRGAVMVFLPDDIQVIKYTSNGETWIENAPYCPPDKSDEQPTEFRQRTGATAKKNIHQLPSIQEGVSSRSLSVSYYAQPVPIRRRGDVRRKSISMIRNGHTGEDGSEVFKQALEKDAKHEIHPGWKSVRRIAGAIGKARLLQNRISIDDSNSETTDTDPQTDTEIRLLSTPSPPRALKKTISQGLLANVDAKCKNQIKLLFNSIDTNGDGQLSVQELAAFASDLGMMHDIDVKSEAEKLVLEMDQDKNGIISLEEFTQYLTDISLLESNA